MAEEKASAAPPAEEPSAPPAQKPILFIVLLVLNMLVVAGVGYILHLNQKKQDAKPTIDQVIQGEHDTHQKEISKEEDFIGSVIPMETFVVNLAGSRGTKLAKVNLELEVNNTSVTEEIDKRKPQLRDMIIIMLSSKTYDQVATKDGKESLKEEIKDTLNSFLHKGQVKRVYFTEFIFN